MVDFHTSVYFDISADDVPLGRVVFELYEDTPITSKNFSTYCAAGGDARQGDHTYTNTIFHRVILGFMMQGGDFTQFNGSGGKSIYGHPFNDQATAISKSHDRPYLLTMANAGPNTNGSQFMITLDRTTWLDGKHAIFGEVVDGQDVLKKVQSYGSKSGKTSAVITVTEAGVLKSFYRTIYRYGIPFRIVLMVPIP